MTCKLSGYKMFLVVVVLNLSAYAYIIYCIFFPWRVFEFVTPVKPVMPVHQGELMLYEMNVIKYQNIPAHSVLSLIGGKYTIHLDDHPSNMPVGKRLTESAVMIDMDVPVGVYKLRWSGTWEVNPLRKVTVVSESDPFEIKAWRGRR